MSVHTSQVTIDLATTFPFRNIPRFLLQDGVDPKYLAVGQSNPVMRPRVNRSATLSNTIVLKQREPWGFAMFNSLRVNAWKGLGLDEDGSMGTNKGIRNLLGKGRDSIYGTHMVRYPYLGHKPHKPGEDIFGNGCLHGWETLELKRGCVYACLPTRVYVLETLKDGSLVNKSASPITRESGQTSSGL
ncbi:uncharacterized protein MCYG_00673 [Microsporum canis CBS 113480]|uniref:Uncharacterized protein n=1 Tax=Arthroderma otae (strain ATCC MYA-4605 / CBS 113480) TaxID=554155 RepID=C5FDA1_ARTOC|nr:uncharacterized protein MCYG_00673 [Microsporum canis CBS 113480]EEQ27785.1 predicted protein [Microsporum canis CBS 113480]